MSAVQKHSKMANVKGKSMPSLYSWLKRREVGLNQRYGGVDGIYRTLYNTISAVHGGCNPEVPAESASRSAHGGCFNLEFSPTG